MVKDNIDHLREHRSGRCVASCVDDGTHVRNNHGREADRRPLANEKQMRRVQAMIVDAHNEGVPVIAEARLIEGTSSDGFFVRPTLLKEQPRSTKIARKEVFGPIPSLLSLRMKQTPWHLPTIHPMGSPPGFGHGCVRPHYSHQETGYSKQ